MSTKSNALPQGWVKLPDGGFARTDDKATAAQAGKRWIAVVAGETLSGDGGRARYFGTPAAAMAASDEVIGSPAPAVEPDPAAAPVAKPRPKAIPVTAKGKAPKPAKVPTPRPTRGATAPKAPAAPRPTAAGGKRLAVPFADDVAWPALATTHGFTAEGNCAAGSRGTIELNAGGGLWVPKFPSGEPLTSATTGKFRGFPRPSSALQALVDAKG